MSKKSPTKSESERMDKLSRSGCVVCRQQFGAYVDGEIHHLTSGGRRLGHDYTVCLCPWHHRGVGVGNYTPDEMRRIYGPSIAHGRGPFELAFGLEEYLLEATDRWLGTLKQPRD